MKSPINFLIVGIALIAFLGLAVAGEPEANEPQSPETETPETAEAEEHEQAAEQLRERMRQRRTERTQGEGPAAERMQRLRERGPAMAWWEPEAAPDGIELTETQREAIIELNQACLDTLRQARQTLATSQRELSQAIAGGNSEAIDEVLARRAEASSAMQQAEADWILGLRETLGTETLSQLARQRPRAVTRCGGGPPAR